MRAREEKKYLLQFLRTAIWNANTLDLEFTKGHAKARNEVFKGGTLRLHQIEMSPVDKQVLWINDVVSIRVHVHLSDTIGNETRQTIQRASSHQQYNGSVVGPRRRVKPCAVRSPMVHEWAFSSESPY
ncbi:hypothetical protein AVEN_204701-1 [Araneus ventricosus]|uniref:Uncharacterized protein n=1 Tax=Araneus ventricosus TaxID=182803 RepID=A0A4Y2GJ32_ARAVE|nr:hypothetical protein AVEN_204701-1 [Araneus ventricosus]